MLTAMVPGRAHHTTTSDELKTKAIRERDAARYLGLSTSFLRAARIGRGSPGPAYVRAGRAIVYVVADLDAWLEQHRVVTREAAGR